jgi:hypothetical protein
MEIELLWPHILQILTRSVNNFYISVTTTKFTLVYVQDRSNWPVGFGQLTPKGKMMQVLFTASAV